MSWRFLLLTLLLAFGAAAFGGIQLGEWLVAHAPLIAPAADPGALGPQGVVLNADGKPYLAQPPQPLVDGTLGVPDSPPPVAWNAHRVSLLTLNTNPNVLASARKLSTDELRYLNQASGKLPPEAAEVAVVDTLPPGEGSRTTGAVSRHLVATAAGRGGNWQQLLRDELEQCAKLGFFDRPSCAWAARNRYCEINQAWGDIHECPRRPN